MDLLPRRGYARLRRVQCRRDAEGAVGRFLRWWKVMLSNAGFTISSPDMIALGIGEIQGPEP